MAGWKSCNGWDGPHLFFLLNEGIMVKRLEWGHVGGAENTIQTVTLACRLAPDVLNGGSSDVDVNKGGIQ
ncbi:hypothetical protein EBZ35_08470 [bacterium]|nr:hypothetical protein [bacterium]